MDYKRFIYYAVVTAMVSLERKVIRKNVINNPDISVIREMPVLQQFAESFYRCEYKKFLEAYVEIAEELKTDQYLSQHA